MITAMGVCRWIHNTFTLGLMSDESGFSFLSKPSRTCCIQTNRNSIIHCGDVQFNMSSLVLKAAAWGGPVRPSNDCDHLGMSLNSFPVELFPPISLNGTAFVQLLILHLVFLMDFYFLRPVLLHFPKENTNRYSDSFVCSMEPRRSRLKKRRRRRWER